MAKPDVYWFYNHTTNNVAKTAGSGSDANFKPITTGTGASAFTLLWTGSSANDEDATGTRDTIIIPESGSTEIDKTFIDDGSIIDQVSLAGTNQGQQQGGDNRYVLCIHVAGQTQLKRLGGRRRQVGGLRLRQPAGTVFGQHPFGWGGPVLQHGRQGACHGKPVF